MRFDLSFQQAHVAATSLSRFYVGIQLQFSNLHRCNTRVNVRVYMYTYGRRMQFEQLPLDTVFTRRCARV